MSNLLKDIYGRQVNYLRMSVTDRCNLKCTYCTPKDINFIDHKEVLSYEEMLKIAKLLSDNGIEKIRITGGEPLKRKDLPLFIRELNKLEKIREISLTTNATLLAPLADELKVSGINRINISLDTIKKDVFKKITGRDQLDKVMDGIDAAVKAGMNPVKINTVLLKGLNDNEIIELASLSRKRNFHVRFIELMPIGVKNYHETHYLPSAFAFNMIENKLGKLERVKSSKLAGPASMYKLKGSQGEIGFIHAMTNHFCNTCNRLRLSTDGRLRPCLLKDYSVNLKRALRSNQPDDELIKIIKDALNKKSYLHDAMPDVHTKMVSIGG